MGMPAEPLGTLSRGQVGVDLALGQLVDVFDNELRVSNAFAFSDKER